MFDEPQQRVVCFDLGGVLVRICRSWAEACARASLPERNAMWFGSAEWRARRRSIVDRYQEGSLECSAYYAELARASDDAYSTREHELIHDAWTLEEYAGARALVRSLNQQSSVTTACLSNTNHGHWVRLAGLDGKNEYPAVLELRHRLASHLLRCSKPDPQIYRLAQQKFSEHGPVRPNDIIFFDDLPENVEAARSVGWDAFLVDHAGDTVGQMRRHLAGAGLRLQ